MVARERFVHDCCWLLLRAPSLIAALEGKQTSSAVVKVDDEEVKMRSRTGNTKITAKLTRPTLPSRARVKWSSQSFKDKKSAQDPVQHYQPKST